MCHNVIPQNDGTLTSLPDCYKSKKTYNKAVDNYAHALEFVPDRYESEKMRNKAVNASPSWMKFVPEYYNTQEMCIKLLILVFCV